MEVVVAVSFSMAFFNRAKPKHIPIGLVKENKAERSARSIDFDGLGRRAGLEVVAPNMRQLILPNHCSIPFKFLLDPFVALLFEFEGKLFGASFYDAAFVEYMDKVGHNKVKQPLIVGNDNDGIVGRAKLINTTCHNAKGINVKATVSLVQDGERGVEHGHLEDFVFLLLATAKSFIDGTVSKVGCHFYHLLFFFHQTEKLTARKRVEAAIFALLIDGCAHKVGNAHARNFDGILKAEEDAFGGTLINWEAKYILAFVKHFACGYGILWIASDNTCKSAFAIAIRSHNGVDFTTAHLKINAFEDFAVAYRGVQITYRKHWYDRVCLLIHSYLYSTYMCILRGKGTLFFPHIVEKM